MVNAKYILKGFLVGILLFFIIPYFSYGTLAVFGYDQLEEIVPSNTLLLYFVLLFVIFLIVNLLISKSFTKSLAISAFLILGVLMAFVVLVLYGFGSLANSDLI